MKCYLKEHYSIGPITQIRETEKESCFIVEAVREYIYKHVDRPDFVEIQQLIAPYLKKKHIAVNEVVLTNTQQAINSHGFYLYTSIPGQPIDTLSTEQLGITLTYLKRYHQALREIPFSMSLFHSRNHWDDAADNDYLRRNLKDVLQSYSFSQSQHQVIGKTLGTLSHYHDLLESSTKQLVHSDIGPGNILFQHNQVTGVIDFTPSYDHELYAVGQLAYWYYLYPQNETTIDDLIEELLSAYDEAKRFEPTLMYAFLFKASLFRFTGLLLEKQCVTENVLKRLEIMENLLQSRYARSDSRT